MSNVKRVRVKICGLREVDKAVSIAKCGADAIGLVFADSPRWVSPEQARDISQALPPLVARVGVFVDASPAAMNRVVEKVGLDYIQLSGSEPPDVVTQLDRPVIRCFQVKDLNWLDEARRWTSEVSEPHRVAAVGLDAYKKGMHGGTGEKFSWELVGDPMRAGALNDLPPLMLSGGLDETNVLTAIQVVEPWVVDVSSGVESAPGVKDVAKANRFIITVIDDVKELTGPFWAEPRRKGG